MLKPSFGLMLLRRSQHHTPAPTSSLHLWIHSWMSKLPAITSSHLLCRPVARKGRVRAKGSRLAYQVARPSLLARCLDEAGVDIAAIQESRCPSGTLHAGPFYRVCSGAEAGHLGTELWIRTGRVILRAAKRQVCLQPRNLIVHHASPRRLLVSLTQGASMYILALHAPHRGSEPHAICQWWSETSVMCNEHVGSHECIIAGDCNAAVGSVCSDFVFDHGAEIEDPAGALFHQLLQERSAWLPATHPGAHSGQCWTFQQKRNGKQVRPDYVAIPYSWWNGCIRSAVETQIHAGQLAPDHFAVTVTVKARLQVPRGTSCPKPAPHRRYDEHAMLQPQNRAVVQHIVDTIPDVDWGTSAHQHAEQVVTQLQTQLQASFPLQGQRRGKRHSFLTDDTWRLHSLVSRLRRKCTACREHISRHTLAAGFWAWKGYRSLDTFSSLCFSPWLHETRCAHAMACKQLAEASKRLRAACSSDRTAFLTKCAHQASCGQDRQAYQAVRRLLGHHRKKPFAPSVLPSLLLEDGTPCQSPDEVANRWRRHFGALDFSLLASALARRLGRSLLGL